MCPDEFLLTFKVLLMMTNCHAKNNNFINYTSKRYYLRLQTIAITEHVDASLSRHVTILTFYLTLSLDIQLRGEGLNASPPPPVRFFFSIFLKEDFIFI